MNGAPRLSGLAPLPGPSPRFLVLGSFPSAESLRRGEYYGFPRNHFWTLLSAAFGEPVPACWSEKTAFLARAGVALWDVAAACERQGSLDQAIRGVEPNPIPALLRSHPEVVRIVLNGSKAAALFVRFFGAAEPVPLAPAAPVSWLVPGGADRSIGLVRVPSSSPVPSRGYRTAADKLPAWRAAFSF